MSLAIEFLLLIGWLNNEHYDHNSVSWRSLQHNIQLELNSIMFL